jgi:LPS-assembly lipoprotein
MQRLLVLVCLLAVLSACGFQPRGKLAVASELGPVQVLTSDPYSPLAQGLSTALLRAGAEPAVEGEPAATLRIRSETLSTRPLSVDSSARVREYQTRYRVVFDVVDAAGVERVAAQDIELSREYTYDVDAAIGSPAEQELLQREMQRDMQAAILRRLDAVLRAN